MVMSIQLLDVLTGSYLKVLAIVQCLKNTYNFKFRLPLVQIISNFNINYEMIV